MLKQIFLVVILGVVLAAASPTEKPSTEKEGSSAPVVQTVFSNKKLLVLIKFIFNSFSPPSVVNLLNPQISSASPQPDGLDNRDGSSSDGNNEDHRNENDGVTGSGDLPHGGTENDVIFDTSTGSSDLPHGGTENDVIFDTSTGSTDLPHGGTENDVFYSSTTDNPQPDYSGSTEYQGGFGGLMNSFKSAVSNGVQYLGDQAKDKANQLKSSRVGKAVGDAANSVVNQAKRLVSSNSEPES